MLKKILIVSLLSCIAMTASAGEGLDKLKTFTANLKSLQADFTQTLFDEKMQQIEISGGKFLLQKPGKFRWDYIKPYENYIIADGKQLWLYDPELEQVTVKPINQALGATPISLLTGEIDLEKQFDIVELGKIEGRQFLQLEVKVKDTDYGVMLLALGKTGLEIMELKDRLGQVTRIEFINPKINMPIDEAKFSFVVPEGVDVIGQ